MSTIASFLPDSGAFDPNDIRSMSTALDEACKALNIGRNGMAKEIIAIRIIELARRGERNPLKLCERVLAEANGATRP